MKIAELIPARTGSKRIPNKNFRDFCGKPLYQWTLDAALESGVFDKIILSSDGGFGGDRRENIVIYEDNRPEEVSNDKATMEQLLGFYAEKYPDIGIWCILQPTSPLRTADDITGAYKMLVEDERDSVVSVFNDPLLFWVKDCVEVQGQQCPVASFHIDKRPNSQDRKDWFKENGAVYFTPTYTLNATGSRCGGRTGLYVMPKERSYEIDDETDWAICELLMNKRLSA
jgi:CMP-N-acetylneuraminic acid synthetase